ncbi:winged helix-turn-helix transcriptional regulator [Streptomyces chrestomyceticus]|uniref:winged helix-turn-helix transcriptional regulator n=1 Tax=Streptomyces chrestomyceticus TaxID=68185 RepID=UPI00378DC747
MRPSGFRGRGCRRERRRPSRPARPAPRPGPPASPWSARSARPETRAGRTREPHSREEPCREVLQILALIGDKWSILVIGQLRDRTLRFGELHRAVTGASQRMLTLTLRQLERDALVTRTVHSCVPPRVDYALTELGTTLLDSVVALGEWAATHRKETGANRRRYDAAHPPRKRP